MQDNCNKNSPKLQAALKWLSVGAALMACQPGSKFYQPGFGPNKKSIKTRKEARRYFANGDSNLAVLLPPGLFCLDLDNDQILAELVEALPPDLLETYYEITGRGAHIFYKGDPPGDLRLRPGVEIKRAVLVAPSRVGKHIYAGVGFGRIAKVDKDSPLFSLLSETKRDDPPKAIEAKPEPKLGNGADDIVSKIKRRFPVLEVASYFTELKPQPSNQSRWHLGRCPLHDDKNPSFWVDAERDVWSCFAPGCPGHSGDGPGPSKAHDVINLYAWANGIDNGEAIRRLAKGVRS